MDSSSGSVGCFRIRHASGNPWRWILTTKLHNASKHPALMVRLKAVWTRSGDRILPVFYSNNCVSLMPGERRTIRTELTNADARRETPRIAVEDFNVANYKITQGL